MLRATRGRAARRGRAAGLCRCGVRVRDPRQVGGGGRPDAWQQVLQHLGKHVAPLARLGCQRQRSRASVEMRWASWLVRGAPGPHCSPEWPRLCSDSPGGPPCASGRAPRSVSGPLSAAAGPPSCLASNWRARILPDLVFVLGQPRLLLLVGELVLGLKLGPLGQQLHPPRVGHVPGSGQRVTGWITCACRLHPPRVNWAVRCGGIGDLWAGTRAQAMATAQPPFGLQAARAPLSGRPSRVKRASTKAGGLRERWVARPRGRLRARGTLVVLRRRGSAPVGMSVM